MRDFAVVGLGYVGLPMAYAATRSGLAGYGFDISEIVVESLTGGRSHIDDLKDNDVRAMNSQGFTASTDPSVLSDAAVILICVPTPLGEGGGPDLSAVEMAAMEVSDRLCPGHLVVLESTTWPGTTEEVVLPILERSGLTGGKDFNLAYSPERIDPGNQRWGVHNTPKVVGGLTAECSKAALAFYGDFIEHTVEAVGIREAEMSKLLENTYRQINIALVNEMLKFSHELGVDFWDVVRLASTKPFGFQTFYPGPGVGGHCIPIDPSYLSHRVKAKLGYPFRFVELAQEINRSMPGYVTSRVQELLNNSRRPVNGAGVLLLGVTYKPGIADQRESPAIPLATALKGLGADLRFYDPFVHRWTLPDGEALDRLMPDASEVSTIDLAVHLQPHSSFDPFVRELTNANVPILDTRGTLEGPTVVHL